MNIQPSYNMQYRYQTAGVQNYSSNPSFCGKTDKLIDQILTTQRLKQINITFDEARNIIESKGYKIVFKRGSHVSVPVGEDKNLTMMIPHNNRKYMCYQDVKRIKFLLEDDIKGALSVR